MKYLLAAVLLLSISLNLTARRTVWNLIDCEEGTWQTIHDGATAGDTLNVPAGTCVWTAGVTFSKALKLHGAGIGLTIIQDNIDDGTRVFTWTCDTSGLHEMTGIEFEEGGRGTTYQSTLAGLVHPFCNNSAARWNIGQNKFDHLNGSPMLGVSSVIGVIHNNTFLFDDSKTPIYCYAQYWKGIGNYGDNAWADTVDWGGEDFTFIEANTFTRDAGGVYAATDEILGCRAVIRFNTGTRVEFQIHGTETALRNRGGRANEVYNNTLSKGGEACNSLVQFRSGSGLVFNNAFNDCGSWVGSPKIADVVDDRVTAAFEPWGSANGTSVWDINHGSNPFYSGTVASAVAFVLDVSPSPVWSNDQWIGYILKKTSACSGNCSSIITDNDADSLVWSGSDGHGAAMEFSAGNTFTINRVLETLDQPGRGGGTLLSGDPPDPAPPVSPYDQTDDPIYEWLNTNDAALIHIIRNDNCGLGAVIICRENEHYYNYTTTFDGTTGVGSGTRANRPATCTTGVAYWSTDQGSWNLSGAGGQGVLDKCTATNTWTNGWYVPYVYPHPLQGQITSGSGTANSSLRVRH